MNHDSIVHDHYGFAVTQAAHYFNPYDSSDTRDDLIQAALEGLLIAAHSADWDDIATKANPTSYFLSLAKREMSALLVQQTAQHRPASLGCGCGAATCARCERQKVDNIERGKAGERLPKPSVRASQLDALTMRPSVPLEQSPGVDGETRFVREPADTCGLAPGEADEADLLEELYCYVQDVADELGAPTSDILHLAYVEGLNDRQIAEELGLSRSAVQRLRTSADDRVRSLMFDALK